MPLNRRLAAEFLGTAFLLVAVVGGGIAAQRLSPDDVGLQLFEAAVVTAFGLAVFIMMFGPISGAHFNPSVTLTDMLLGRRTKTEALAYIAAQILGGVFGTVLANLMFELPAVEISTTVRSGSGQWLGELVATIGLLLVIFLLIRHAASIYAIGGAVGAYIGGAYFFTSSTSFANPAVAIARMFSDTFAGIAPASAPAFIFAQLLAVPLVVAMLRFWTVDE
ncbi:MAG: aquaporin family protein [Acidimicrobiia bacterium]|nr:aquaporin family protein [Acidimicrobiia bacterium]